MTDEQTKAVNNEIDELVNLAVEAIKQDSRARLPLTIIVGCAKDPITGAELTDEQKGHGVDLAWIPIMHEHEDREAKDLIFVARATAVAGEAACAIHFAMTTGVMVKVGDADIGKSGDQVATEHGITTGAAIDAHPDAKMMLIALVEERDSSATRVRMWDLVIDQGFVEATEIDSSTSLPAIPGGLPSILLKSDAVVPEPMKASARRTAFSYLMRANEWANAYDDASRRSGGVQ